MAHFSVSRWPPPPRASCPRGPRARVRAPISGVRGGVRRVRGGAVPRASEPLSHRTMSGSRRGRVRARAFVYGASVAARPPERLEVARLSGSRRSRRPTDIRSRAPTLTSRGGRASPRPRTSSCSTGTCSNANISAPSGGRRRRRARVHVPRTPVRAPTSTPREPPDAASTPVKSHGHPFARAHRSVSRRPPPRRRRTPSRPTGSRSRAPTVTNSEIRRWLASRTCSGASSSNLPSRKNSPTLVFVLESITRSSLSSFGTTRSRNTSRAWYMSPKRIGVEDVGLGRDAREEHPPPISSSRTPAARAPPRCTRGCGSYRPWPACRRGARHLEAPRATVSRRARK